jgi:glycolate oxidase
MKKDRLYHKIIKIVEPNRVINDKRELVKYRKDSMQLPKTAVLLFNTKPDYVIKPKSSEEISKIIKLACTENIPVIPRGTGSWSLGGTVPSEGGIVLDMSLMNNILKVDDENLEIEVEAGASWRKVYNVAMEDNLSIGTYPHIGAKSTVGGWINTERIGIGTYKYGSVRSHIRTMEVVLPEGQIINTGFNKVMSNSSGYNLNGLFLGSEGTLGVVTKVRLKVYPAPEMIRSVVVEYDNLQDAFPLLKAVARAKILPFNISFSDENHSNILNKLGGQPTSGKARINITLDGTEDNVNSDIAVLEKIVSEKGGVFASDETADRVWKERFFDYEGQVLGVNSGMGNIIFPLNKFENVVKLSNILNTIMKMDASITGILGDRNSVILTTVFVFPEKKARSLANLAYIKKLGDVAYKNDGRLLGIGLFFASHLPKLRGKGAETMFDIKTALDPHDILNPGKLVEGTTRYGPPLPRQASNLGLNAAAVGKRVLPKNKIKDK